MLVLLLLGSAVGIATVWANSHRLSGERPASGLSLAMASAGRSGGADLTSAPAVASDQINRRLLEASAASGGDVEVSLAWNTLTDLDLSVRDPSQTLTDAYHPHTLAGQMDIDANPTPLMTDTTDPRPGDVLPITEDSIGALNGADSLGALLGMGGGDGAGASERRGGKARSKFSLTPVEHIYYAHAPRGVYTVYARCFWWREPTPTPLPFTVQIKSRGQVFREVSGVIGPRNYVADRVQPTIVCQFEVR